MTGAYPQGSQSERLYTEDTMIKVASFKISDSDGINNLLSKYRLASGAHILVSEGQLCVPYEDGLEPNNEQKAIEILEQKKTMQIDYRMLTHSQRVLEEQIKDIEGKIAMAKGGRQPGAGRPKGSITRPQLRDSFTKKKLEEFAQSLKERAKTDSIIANS
jgi:hypothetical protein